VGAHLLSTEHVDVALVGGGPSGLTAATALCRAGAGKVVVLEREAEPGGIPRHAKHQGFGLRDLHRALSGPRYAERLTDLAVAAGAELRIETQVTGWTDAGALELTSPSGRSSLQARAVVLATGCRERPRAARLVPGTRPQGVLTTGMLQQLVYLARELPGRRAVIVGAEHVSFSALLTLAPVLTRTAITAIRGLRRVEAVEVTHLDTGEVRELECDLVVFTADWIPDHELAVLAGAALDPGTRGPAVDSGLHTSRPGLFAVGNVLHGAETADVAALSGRHVAASVLRHLDGEPWPTARVPIECRPPLTWVAPNSVSARAMRPSRSRYLLRSSELMRMPLVELSQDGRTLWRGRRSRLMPGRSACLPWVWTNAVDADGGPVVAHVVGARNRIGAC
jgi:thioredoxin reductase